jgi:hypothetical protein
MIFHRHDPFKLNLGELIMKDESPIGKIIFYTDQKTTSFTKEKNNCIHHSNDEPHSHGKLTFHLIEGLDGKAADHDTGIITIDSLRKYIEHQMLQEKGQGLWYAFNENGSYMVTNLKIAVSQKEFDAKIASLIKSGENLLTKSQKNDFIDIQNIFDAAKKINELIKLDPKNKEIPRLVDLIDNALDMYKHPTLNWLDSNMRVASHEINKIFSNFYDYDLPELVYSLSFNKLVTLSNAYVKALFYIMSHVRKNTQFENTEDPKLVELTNQLREVFYNERRRHDLFFQ